MVPRRGEQCLVENNSYMGYSPPKCTCNAISHIQGKTFTFLLKCLHAMDENVTHHVLTDSLTHAYAKCENHHLYSINDHFSKTKAFCFINQNPLDKLRYLLVFTKSRVFWSHRRLRMPSDTFSNFLRWIHMSNQEHRVFHPRGYLSLLAIPNTCTFPFLFSFMQP